MNVVFSLARIERRAVEDFRAIVGWNDELLDLDVMMSYVIKRLLMSVCNLSLRERTPCLDAERQTIPTTAWCSI